MSKRTKKVIAETSPNYGAIQLASFPDVIIGELVKPANGDQWTIHVPPFPELDYDGWTLSVGKSEVVRFEQTNEQIALAYLRAALPPMPDFTKRDWRGKAKLKFELSASNLSSAYETYSRGSSRKQAKKLTRAEFEEVMGQMTGGYRYGKY